MLSVIFILPAEDHASRICLAWMKSRYLCKQTTWQQKKHDRSRQLLIRLFVIGNFSLWGVFQSSFNTKHNNSANRCNRGQGGVSRLRSMLLALRKMAKCPLKHSEVNCSQQQRPRWCWRETLTKCPLKCCIVLLMKRYDKESFRMFDL